MDWSTQRKTLYAVILASVIIFSLIYLFRGILFPTPTCFDKKQNGYESGVDCGGTCSLRCSNEISPISVEWARAVIVSPSKYDLVAMLSNKNIDNSPRALEYSFVVYNSNGNIIKEIKGQTVAPVDGEFPIIKQSVVLSQEPKEVVVNLNSNPHYTVAEKSTSPTIRASVARYEAGSIPRVYSVISNTKRITISNLSVRAVLYDEDNNVFAVGETLIPFLDKEGSENITFTWDHPLAKAPTNIRIYPIFDPFSVTK